MVLEAKSPELKWLHSFFEPKLLAGKAYTIDQHQIKYKLDQNECHLDWPVDLKEDICRQMLNLQWNRYPNPYDEDMHQLIASYYGVKRANFIAGPGSNHMLCVLLSILTKKMSGKLVIARPSFPLYEQYCQFHGIAYEAWTLNSQLQYDVQTLPSLPENSVLIFASPNNPVGNALSVEDLESILTQHPSTMVIADEAYFEFAKEPYTKLLESYGNLILVRTFSKAMASASLRLGCVLASDEVIEIVKKATLPFSINSFSSTAVSTILKSETYKALFLNAVDELKEEREHLKTYLQGIGARSGFQVLESEANFLLLRWREQEACQKAYQTLIRNGILTRNVSAGPMLEGCLRLTVGAKEENEYVKKIFKENLSSQELA